MKKITCQMTVLCLLYGCSTEQQEETQIPQEETEQAEETDIVILPAEAQYPSEKNERITVHTDASGTVKDIEDEFTLIPAENAKAIRDISSLSDIWNKDGDEEYITDTDGTYVWNCTGESITASGNGTAQLPVGVKITYYLNGQEVSADQIAEKSGHVKIRFDYENHTGTGTDIVPFAALTVFSLPDQHFSNVKGTNMKVIRSSGSSMIAGVALPGWKDALPLASLDMTEDIDLPVYMEAEADTDSFALDFTATVFTNGLFRELDEDTFIDASGIDEKIDQVFEALDKMVSSGNDLYSGADTFRTYLKQYTDGIGQIADGADALSSGTEELYEQSAALQTGAEQLSTGLVTLKEAVVSLDPANIEASLDAEKQTEYREAREALISDAEILIRTAEDFQTDTETLNAYFDEMKTYIQSAAGSVKALEEIDPGIFAKAAQDAAAAQDTINAAAVLLENEALSGEEKEKLSALIASSEEMCSDINTLLSLAEKMQETIRTIQNVPALPAIIIDDSTKETAADMIRQMQRIADAVQGSIPDIDLQQFLEDACKMKDGIIQLADGSVQLKDGVSAFRTGISQLKDGSAQLDTGIRSLSAAGTELNNGYSSLLNGIGAFRDGLQTFRNEGKEKIGDLNADGISDLMRSLDTLRINDRNWRSYSGIADETEGSTLFIFESESIKAK